MVLSWGLTMVLGALIALLLVRPPQLQRANWTGTVSWEENRLELLSAMAIALLCWIGLARVIAGAARLLGAMRRDSFLPSYLAPDSHSNMLAERAVALVAVIAMLATQFGSPIRLAGIATVTFVWAAAITLEPWIRNKKAAEASRLPFHPLIPALGVGITVFLTFVMPWVDPFAVIGWVLVGCLVYVSFARQASRETLPRAASAPRLTGPSALSKGASKA